MTPWRGLLLASLVLPGCKKGEDPDDLDGTTVLSEGAGPANDAPLWPLPVGARYGMTDGSVQTVLGTDVRGGVDVVRFHGAGGVSWFATGGPGVRLVAATSDGDLDVPLLLVPDTVRVGMAWEVDLNLDGAPDVSFEVTDRAPDTPTPVGPATVWTISQDDGVVLRTYAEGYGLLSVGNYVTESLILPRDPQPEMAPPESPRPMTSIHESLFEAELATLSVVQRGESVSLTPLGYGVFWNGSEYLRVPWSGCHGVVRQPLLESLRTEPATNSDTMGQPAHTLRVQHRSRCLGPGHAGGALAVGAEVTYTSRPENGAVRPPNSNQHNRTPFLFYHHPTEGPQVMWWRPIGVPTGSTVSLVSDVGYHVPDQTHLRGDHLFLPLPVFTSIENHGFPLIRTLNPTHMGADGMPLMLETRSGLLVHAWVPPDGPPGAPKLAGYSGGRLTTRLDEHGREFLVTTLDGAIDRLRPTQDGVVRERLASVHPPDGHQLVGAFRWGDPSTPAAGDDLALLTYDGVHLTPGSSSPDWVGGVHLWRAVLDEPTLEPVHPPPSLVVSAVPAGPDAVVCWHDTGTAASAQGWSLGGAPVARAVPEGTDCVTLIRDHHAADPPWTLGGHRIRGTIPGVGEAFLAVPHAEDAAPAHWALPGVSTNAQIAATTDGGLTTLVHRFTEGAHVRSTTPYVDGEPAGGGTGGVPDLAGHGMWVGADRGTAGRFVYRTGVDLLEVTGVGSTIVGRSVDGGVLTHSHVIDPDGRVAPIDLTGLYANANVLAVRLADGTVCSGPRVGGSGLACQDPDGTLRESVFEGFHYRWHRGAEPLPTGELVFLLDDAVWMVDPADFAETELGQVALMAPAHGADGSLWALRADRSAVVQITATGLEEIPLPADAYTNGLPDSIAVANAAILVRFTGPVARHLRIARP